MSMDPQKVRQWLSCGSREMLGEERKKDWWCD
jgi:hypothetical protein